MDLRSTYIARIEAELEELKLERYLDALDRRPAHGAGRGAGGGARGHGRTLQAKQQVLLDRLERARDASEGQWENARKELESAWRDLKSTLRQVAEQDGE